MKKLNASTSSFEKLITNNNLYVDKTEFIWNLIQNEETYFMARPRRFGKSLTVSTLEAIFQGKRELFKGLAIYDKEYDWTSYPIIRLDLGKGAYTSLEKTSSALCNIVERNASSHAIKLKHDSPNEMFQDLIIALKEKHNKKVVILVDEYDKPIVDTLGKPFAKDVLELLKPFYTVIKSYDADERFVFITGVSKFSHVSLFSGLNNPTDISMWSEYATMLGYTQNELESVFAEHIEAAAQKLNMPREDLLKRLKEWYDGFCFEADSETVYNPFSIAKFFESAKPKFSNYWFDTATPTFLIDYCKNNQFDLESALTDAVPSSKFSAYEIDNINPLALFLQTGYLTIKDAYEEFGFTYYHLGFPNKEVLSSFEEKLLDAYTEMQEGLASKFSVDIVRMLRKGEVEAAMQLLKSFYAGFPFKIQERSEHYYQAIFFAIFRSLGFSAFAESPTSDGSIDAVVEIDNWVYIFEFKLDVSAEEAMRQIKEKDYYRKYLMTGKQIVLIGANFVYKTRQLDKWIIEEIRR